MKLAELMRAAGVAVETRGGDAEIAALAYDSRLVEDGTPRSRG